MGLVIPWGIRLYAKKEAAGALKLRFKKTTEPAGELFCELTPPKGVRVVVLFDAFCLCRPVVRVCFAHALLTQLPPFA